MDPAFKNVISGSSQLASWRIKQFQLVSVSPQDMGQLFSGDCYLFFNRRQKRSEIFYWIGRTSSIDERATVAIKAVELDDAFGGVPVQHREKDGYESEAFKSLFPDGLIKRDGGFETGFKKTQNMSHLTRMYKVAGGNIPMLSEVPISWSSMNHGDTFVLDSGELIFVWRGRCSSGAEALTAAKLATRLKNKMGEQIITLDDGDEESLTEGEKSVWEKYLQLANKHEVVEADKTSDKKHSRVLTETRLFRCTETNGNLSTVLVKTGNLVKDDLDSGDAFVVEAGSSGVWVWLGTHSSQIERRGAMDVGEKVIKDRNLPSHTRISRINMNSEPEEFKSLFLQWT